MFVTASIFAVPAVARLMKPGQAAWSAVGLSTRLSWFILTVQQEEEGEALWTDILMSDSSAIGDMLESPSPPAVIAVHMLSVDPVDRTSWKCRVAHQVWRGADARASKPAIYFVDDHGEFWQEPFEIAKATLTDRTLLADFRPSVQAESHP